MGDIGLQDESAAVVIIGGGPHALACLAALEGFQHDNEDTLQRVGTGSCAPVAGMPPFVLPCPLRAAPLPRPCDTYSHAVPRILRTA